MNTVCGQVKQLSETVSRKRRSQVYENYTLEDMEHVIAVLEQSPDHFVEVVVI
jgi:hypothetical protein